MSSTLTAINVFPIKSTAGIELSRALVELQGLNFDRRFMVSDSRGDMVTARKYPEMVNVEATPTESGLYITAPNKEALHLTIKEFDLEIACATVWSDQFPAYTTTKEADAWFSEYLGMDVELLYTGQESRRIRQKLGHNVSFADGYPLLVISEGSLKALNQRSSEQHSMSQFRTNLVVSGAPFIEDTWKRFRIGEVEFEVVKPCERCIMTTIDTPKAAFRPSKEPLTALSTFRANNHGSVFFGQNVVAKNRGVIHQHDEVEVLEYKEPDYYLDTQSDVSEQNTASQINSENVPHTVKIRIQGMEFEGNTQQPLLDQTDIKGIPIRNSCRAGLCGACRVVLKSGEVDQPMTPAMDILKKREENYILACCATPKSDIEIE
ncbi:YcbX family protein [Vibrio sp.]|nr:YcbX family protein [Vibrio sp.]